MSVSVIVPALNEEGAIGHVVASMPWASIAECIVVDNGSSDRTGEVAAAAGARVVTSPRGYGAAVSAGARAALAESDILVFLDGDGADDIGAMAEIVGPIERNEADFVIGSRIRGKREPGAMNFSQVFAAHLIGTLVKMMYGFRYTDMGAFRAIRRSKLEAMQMQEMTYGWNLEMQIKAIQDRLRIVEVPVNYRNRMAGESKVSGNLKASVKTAWRIFGVLARTRRRQDQGLGIRSAMEAIVELEHVNVARGKKIVLHDVNLSVRAGEHLAILGPNGCGKSTLLKTMTCELYPVATPNTRVRIFGRERWDLTELKRRMGVVSAELPGRPILATSGFDAILTGFFSSSTLWPNLTVTDAMRKRAEEIVSLVGAEKLRGKLVSEMSAGEQRRVMIGRALAGASLDGEVRMLLLDEPSNALDMAAQRDLREMLRGLAQRGVAIVLITHHIGDILPEMERVVMMRGGRIVADGAKKELLTEKKLGQMFGREITLTEHSGFFSAW